MRRRRRRRRNVCFFASIRRAASFSVVVFFFFVFFLFFLASAIGRQTNRHSDRLVMRAQTSQSSGRLESELIVETRSSLF